MHKFPCKAKCGKGVSSYAEAREYGWQRYYESAQWGTGFVCSDCIQRHYSAKAKPGKSGIKSYDRNEVFSQDEARVMSYALKEINKIMKTVNAKTIRRKHLDGIESLLEESVRR